MSVKGTRTERNLLTAFAGESQARNKYSFFASKAKEEGYVQIARVFEETAEHERAHAKRLFKFLEGGEVRLDVSFPAGTIGSTAENLKAAAGGERHEHESMYPSFAKEAEEEGFAEIAEVFRCIAISEKQHERRFLGLLKNVKESRVFEKEGPVSWKCLNCGFIAEGPTAPEPCPACDHPQAFFEILCENW